MTKKPNVIFILTDDQGYGDLGCTGNPWILTPNIDEFYAKSVRFTNFHVGPTCAPTRSTLMTGHYANSTGVWHTVGGRSLLRKNEVTLGAAFKNAGYKTGIFGKWHLGDNAPYRPEDRGFDEVIVHGGGGIGQAPDWWGNDYFDDTYRANGEQKKFDGYCTDVWFSEALSFIQRNQDNPFFCYIPTNAPHGPFNIMHEYREIYRDKLDLTQAAKRERFYGMITHLDEQFGKLENELKKMNILDNTILIFMTDNGTSCGAKFDDDGSLINGWNAGLRGTKNSEYDGGHRVPFLMRWPDGGYANGSDVDTLTASIDLMPTLLDLCGITHELSFHGTSLKPLIESSLEKWPDRAVVTDSQRITQPEKWRKSAVMTDRWRLINGIELYDIQQDRAQQDNLADVYPQVVEKLRFDYDNWWNLVSPQFEEEIPISIGADSAEVSLSSHDWRGDGDHAVWNQSQIRAGRITNSYWELDIQTAGTYRIELCRWPKYGSGRAITEGIDGDDVVWNRDEVDESAHGFYTGGRAIDVKQACIEIQDQYRRQSIESGQSAAVFELILKRGQTHLLTRFIDGDDQERGAYYTYIRRIA